MVIDCTSCGAPLFATDLSCASCGADNKRYIDPHILKQRQQRQMILSVVTITAVALLGIIIAVALWPEGGERQTMDRVEQAQFEAQQELNAQAATREAAEREAEEEQWAPLGTSPGCGEPPRFDQLFGGYPVVTRHVEREAGKSGAEADVGKCTKRPLGTDSGWAVTCDWTIEESNDLTYVMKATAVVCNGAVQLFPIVD